MQMQSQNKLIIFFTAAIVLFQAFNIGLILYFNRGNSGEQIKNQVINQPNEKAGEGTETSQFLDFTNNEEGGDKTKDKIDLLPAFQARDLEKEKEWHEKEKQRMEKEAGLPIADDPIILSE